MRDNAAVSIPQMNLETALAQEALRDEAVQGRSDPQADHRHETRDADTTRIAWIGAGMAALGIGLFISLWLLLNLFQRLPDKSEPPISPLALNPPTPSAPRIQDVTAQNYVRFLRREQETLTGSGPNPPGETRRIPIEEAKTALLQSGLPTRPQSGRSPFPQNAPAAGQDKPESLPLGMQPTGAYRADVGPMGKNP